jgi:hypothetical protein
MPSDIGFDVRAPTVALRGADIAFYVGDRYEARTGQR